MPRFPYVALVAVCSIVACGGAPTRTTVPRRAIAAAESMPPTQGAPPVVAALPYPATRRGTDEATMFGVVVRDPYRWLEDGKSPEVVAWTDAQDGLARNELTKLPRRDVIAARQRQFYETDAVGLPSRFGGRLFYDKRDAHAERSTVRWREGDQGDERVLLDPATFSADGSAALGNWSVSWDGKTVAYVVTPNNADAGTIHVRDVATGKDSTADVIDGAQWASPSWNAAGSAFYYVQVPTDAGLSQEQKNARMVLKRHALGTDPKNDPVVHGATNDPEKFLQGWASRDGRWLLASIARGAYVDEYFQDLSRAPGTWKPLVEAIDADFRVLTYRGTFYVRTNDGAPNARVFAVDPAHPARAAWKEIVPERSDATLDGIQIAGGKLLLSYMKNAIAELRIVDLDGAPVRTIALPEPGSAAVSADDDDDEAFVGFESFTHPPEIWRTSIAKGGRTPWYTKDLPADLSRFVVEQELFTSKDGTRVPMFVLHAKDVKKDGTAPTILYGYGGFRLSETPSFSSEYLTWIEQGGVYAIANLRGGSEYGEAWHRHGMLHEKQHVFDDMIAAGEHLVAAGYTSPQRLVARGGSNGGLLVAAVVTQRPDLFGGGICAVPLTDMVRFPLFGDGRFWVGEYGDPKNEADFRALYAYSPYHHVERGTRYPAMLFLSSEDDDRVDPLHARKMAAAMQDASSGGPVLLRVERHAGHSGADQMSAWVDEVADTFAFALAVPSMRR